jgi:hypothetical protein
MNAVARKQHVGNPSRLPLIGRHYPSHKVRGGEPTNYPSKGSASALHNPNTLTQHSIAQHRKELQNDLKFKIYYLIITEFNLRGVMSYFYPRNPGIPKTAGDISTKTPPKNPPFYTLKTQSFQTIPSNRCRFQLY